MTDAEVARLQQELNASNATCMYLQQELKAAQSRAQSRYSNTLLANRRVEQLEGIISDRNFIIRHEMTRRLSLERSVGALTEQLEQVTKEKDAAIDVIKNSTTNGEIEQERQKMRARNEQEVRLHKLAVDQESQRLRISWQEETRKKHKQILSTNQQLQKLYQDNQEKIMKLKQSEDSLKKELIWHKEKIQQRALEQPTGVITHAIGSPSPMRDLKKRKLNENCSPSSRRHFSPQQPSVASLGRNEHIGHLNRSPPPAPNFLGTGSPSSFVTPTNLTQAFAARGIGAGFNPSHLQSLISTQSTGVDIPNSCQDSPTRNSLQNHRPPSRPESVMASTLQNSPLIPGIGMLIHETLLQDEFMSRPATPSQQMSSSISNSQQPHGPMTPARRDAELMKLEEEFNTCSAQVKQHLQNLTSPQRYCYLRQRLVGRTSMSNGSQEPNLGQEAGKPHLQQSLQPYQHIINSQQTFKISPFGHTLLHASREQNSHQVQQQPAFSNSIQSYNMCPQSRIQVAQMQPTISPPSRQCNNTFPEPVKPQSNEAAKAHSKATTKINLRFQTTGPTIPVVIPTPSPSNAAAPSHTTSTLNMSPPIFVPRRVACLRCTENWWDKSCDSGEPCSNCEVDTMSKRECIRPKCENFATGTCIKGAACKRAHEDDRYDHVESYKKTLKRTGRMRDSAVAPSLRVGSSQNSQESSAR